MINFTFAYRVALITATLLLPYSFSNILPAIVALFSVVLIIKG